MFEIKDYKNLLQKFSYAFSVPIQIYRNDQILYTCNEVGFSPNPSYIFMKPYIHTGHKVCFVVSPEYLHSGYIELTNPGEYMILGPTAPYEFSPRQAEKLLAELGQPPKRLLEFQRFLHYTPSMTTANFQHMLDFFNMLIRPDDHEAPIHLTYQVQHISLSNAYDLDSETSIDTKSEEILGNIITYGKEEEVLRFFEYLSESTPALLPNLGPNTLRTIKNTFIASTAIASRYAVDGGLDYKTSIMLSDYYINKIENLVGFSEVNELLRTMILDFTRRVAICQRKPSNSATVNAIYQDIQIHRYEKISSKDIAARLQLDISYLSRHFKKNTGKTITQYIHEQKIREARYLLKTSNLSLVMIAEKLGYSSQQQFQQVFKKVTGTTPKQFQKQHQ